MFMSLSTLHNSCYNYITRLVSGNIYASIQNTKYALLSLAEFVEIYALFGRTKQTQNLCAEDQIQFLGLGYERSLQCDGLHLVSGSRGETKETGDKCPNSTKPTFNYHSSDWSQLKRFMNSPESTLAGSERM